MSPSQIVLSKNERMNAPALPFADHLKAHLADYKRNVLLVETEGVWSGNGRP